MKIKTKYDVICIIGLTVLVAIPLTGGFITGDSGLFFIALLFSVIGVAWVESWEGWYGE